MGLKAVVSSLDGLSEEIQKFYTKGSDGKYHLDLEGVEGHPSVLGLQKNKEEILEEKKKLQDKLDALKDVDPEEYRRLKKEMEEAERKKIESGGDVEALKKAHEEELGKVQTEAEKEKKKAEEETEAERKAARRYYKQGEITRAINASEGSVELLSPVVDRFCTVELDDNGEYQLIVTDEKGTKRIKNSSGDAFTIEDLMEELRENEKYQRAFEPSGTTGSGSRGSDKGGKPTPTGARKKFTREQLASGEADIDAISKGEAVVVD